MMTPLGTAGASHVIVIVKKEGIAVKCKGPGAGVRGEIDTNKEYASLPHLLSSSVCVVIG